MGWPSELASPAIVSRPAGALGVVKSAPRQPFRDPPIRSHRRVGALMVIGGHMPNCSGPPAKWTICSPEPPHQCLVRLARWWATE